MGARVTLASEGVKVAQLSVETLLSSVMEMREAIGTYAGLVVVVVVAVVEAVVE